MRVAPSWPEVAVGSAVLGLAGLVGVGTTLIHSPPYAQVGPAVVPWGVAAGLAVLGALLVWQGIKGGWERDAADGIDARSLLWLMTGLALNLVLIDGLSIGETTLIPRVGFILSSTLMFIATARAFGSSKPIRDALIGFLAALIAYVGFDRMLEYKIGSGLIESLI